MYFLYVILGNPRPKNRNEKPIRLYLLSAIAQLERQHKPMSPINVPVNVCCLIYRSDNRRTDLVNHLNTACDVLVKSGILADDNSRIIASMNGSKVLYDKDNPRVEIYISPAVL